MKYLASIILISILSVSLFGFAVMDHRSMGCGSVTGMDPGDCPQTLVSMALHHILAYNSFTGVVISFLFSIIALAYALNEPSFLRPPTLSRARIRDREGALLLSQDELRRWLSLFENSPSLI